MAITPPDRFTEPADISLLLDLKITASRRQAHLRMFSVEFCGLHGNAGTGFQIAPIIEFTKELLTSKNCETVMSVDELADSLARALRQELYILLGRRDELAAQDLEEQQRAMLAAKEDNDGA